MKQTVGTLVKRASEILKSHGSKSPRLDAELLLVHALRLRERVEIYANLDRLLSEEEIGTYKKLIRRRAEGEPVAYITGKKEFYGTEFFVERGVFIPRPETELLVEVTLKKMKGRKNLKIVDVGTGSGCIILSLCKALGREHQFFGTDISEKALKVAEANRKKLYCRNVKFIKGNLLSPISFSVDVVVSNPPYVPIGDEKLEREVLKFEPAIALFGGKKGTEVIERLIKEASKKLNREGFLAVEIGIGQSEEVKKLLKIHGFREIETYRDLSGIERVVTGVKG